MATTRMTQTQLVKSLAEKSEINNKMARGILDHLAALAISEVIKIPAKKVVKFRVAKAAKDAIVPPKKAK
jgi:DNA-binding protein HU-beta